MSYADAKQNAAYIYKKNKKKKRMPMKNKAACIHNKPQHAYEKKNSMQTEKKNNMQTKKAACMRKKKQPTDEKNATYR